MIDKILYPGSRLVLISIINHNYAETMIRFINCVRKKTDISTDEFRRFWNEKKFNDYIHAIVTVTEAIRGTKNLTLDIHANIQLQQDRGGKATAFDGIIEYWWDNAQNLMEIYESEKTTALMLEIHEYQSQFIDFKSSTAFFTEINSI